MDPCDAGALRLAATRGDIKTLHVRATICSMQYAVCAAELRRSVCLCVSCCGCLLHVYQALCTAHNTDQVVFSAQTQIMIPSIPVAVQPPPLFHRTLPPTHPPTHPTLHKHTNSQALADGAPRFHPDADADGFTPLHAAAVEGRAAAVLWLCMAGADPNAVKRDDWLDTPLHYAAARGHTHACQVLLAYGADAGANNAAGVCLHVFVCAHVCTLYLCVSGQQGAAELHVMLQNHCTLRRLWSGTL